MSLSQEPALSLLKNTFVCGWRDISGEPYCGKSGAHNVDNPAVVTTNGAGPTNTQLFILAADGTVLHCLPGYWDARDFACEVALAEELNKVWLDGSLSRERKDARFREMHLAHIKSHSADMKKRSQMQGFDKKHEQSKVQDSDCLVPESELSARDKERGKPVFKTTDRIMHERLVNQPFTEFVKFDVARCVKYGRPKYDKKQDNK